MSTLRDLQDEIAEACNADEYLVQGGCKAFAEDRQDALAEIAVQLETVGGIAIAVSTPDIKFLGGATPGNLPCEVNPLSIRATEAPALSREQPGNITALKAAEHIAHMFHQPGIAFLGIVQTADEQSCTVSATATFKTTIVLTDPAEPAETEA